MNARETAAADDLVLVGRVGAAHGLHGAVFVEPLTDQIEQRFAPGSVLRTEADSGTALTVESVTRSGGKLVVRFAGVTGRDAAEALRGVVLAIRAGERPWLADPDEFYDTQLVGLQARTPGGEIIGEVRAVSHSAGADYLVVEVAGRERLVPFAAAIVPQVDIPGGTVVIDAPEGLFEL